MPPKSIKRKPAGSKDKKPILLVLARSYIMGETQMPRDTLSTHTGYPPKSLGTMLLNLKKKQGHVEYDASNAWLTDAGLKAAKEKYGDAVKAASTNEEAQEQLKEIYKVTGSKLAIFNLLLDGNSYTDKQLQDHIKCKNVKSYGTYISALRSAGIVESVVEEGIKKNKAVVTKCFPHGK